MNVYSREKTLFDCLHKRNDAGTDVVLEALKTYKSQRQTNFDLVLRYAKQLRAEKAMRPYLEAIVCHAVSLPRFEAGSSTKTRRDSAILCKRFERFEWQVQTHRVTRQFCKIESLIETFGLFVHAIEDYGDEREGLARFVAVD